MFTVSPHNSLRMIAFHCSLRASWTDTQTRKGRERNIGHFTSWRHRRDAQRRHVDHSRCAITQRQEQHSDLAAIHTGSVVVCVCVQTRQKHCPSFLFGSFYSNILPPANTHKATESSYKCLRLFLGASSNCEQDSFFLPCSCAGLRCWKHLT